LAIANSLGTSSLLLLSIVRFSRVRFFCLLFYLLRTFFLPGLAVFVSLLFSVFLLSLVGFCSAAWTTTPSFSL
jgi:hypothetical protein